MSGWTIAWLVWIAAFGVVEGLALANRTPGDTLSEHVWKWFGVRGRNGGGWTWKRYALLAFLVWLLGHLTLGWWAG